MANRYIPYICVIQPIDHDNNALTRRVWSGELIVNSGTGAGAFQIGLGSSDLRVCRFTSDYNRNGSLSNREHPRYYRGVTGALSAQNLLVTRGNNQCPADLASDLAANLVDTNTARHQPSPEYSFRCTALDANGFDCASKVYVESAGTTTLPMN